jgi:hypothetical protein
MNNIPIIRNDVNYDVWEYEIKHYRIVLDALANDQSLDPHTKQKVAEEALKDVRRFVWYCIGEVYPC